MDSENKDQVIYTFDGVVTLAELERKHISTALERFGGNKTQAANALGITIKTLYNKLHQYGEFDKYAVYPKVDANEASTEQKG